MNIKKKKGKLYNVVWRESVRKVAMRISEPWTRVEKPTRLCRILAESNLKATRIEHFRSSFNHCRARKKAAIYMIYMGNKSLMLRYMLSTGNQTKIGSEKKIKINPPLLPLPRLTVQKLSVPESQYVLPHTYF